MQRGKLVSRRPVCSFRYQKACEGDLEQVEAHAATKRRHGSRGVEVERVSLNTSPRTREGSQTRGDRYRLSTC